MKRRKCSSIRRTVDGHQLDFALEEKERERDLSQRTEEWHDITQWTIGTFQFILNG